MSHPVVLFDGVCNFCNSTINFLIRQDKKGILHFATLQSPSGQQLLKQYGLPLENFESFVVLEKGKAYTGSTASLKVCRQLPWYWQWTRIFWVVPRPFRDAVYNFIARHRYQWFGKKDQCMLPDEKIKERFI